MIKPKMIMFDYGQTLINEVKFVVLCRTFNRSFFSDV